MPERTVADGETLTIADTEEETFGPLVLDGTVSLDGTMNLAEATISGSAAAGATATGAVAGEKRVVAAARAGVTVSATLDSLVPLRRVTDTAVSNDRTDDFTVQGAGDVDE